MWVADVGQNKIEEIDIVLNGGNYGWNFMEGSDCYGSSADCQTPGLIKPIFEYSHSVGQSITVGSFIKVPISRNLKMRIFMVILFQVKYGVCFMKMAKFKKTNS